MPDDIARWTKRMSAPKPTKHELERIAALEQKQANIQLEAERSRRKRAEEATVLANQRAADPMARTIEAERKVASMEARLAQLEDQRAREAERRAAELERKLKDLEGSQ
jgi:hypothetical protein